MSLDVTIARVAQLETAFSPPVATSATATAPASMTAATGAGSLASLNQLQGALATGGVQPVAGTGGGPGVMVQIAQAEVGQAEQPPGSNNSARIAQVRSAVQGRRRASRGVPTSHRGWRNKPASRSATKDRASATSETSGTGRRAPAVRSSNGPGVVPSPGNLIIFGDHHVGIVEKVLPNGSIQTIEGNYSDQVSRVVRGAGEATGYVRVA